MQAHGMDVTRNAIGSERFREMEVDSYFSADVETDGSIPGPYSMLSFGIVYAGQFDGREFTRPTEFGRTFYRELQPISEAFDPEALRVNGLDRNRLLLEGSDPAAAMTEAGNWIQEVAADTKPVLIAYPLSFDWAWLYWYFTRFSKSGSPFGHSRCFDIKTAFAVKAQLPIAAAGRSRVFQWFEPRHTHTHHALDDAIEQAEIFADIFEWHGVLGSTEHARSSR